MGFVLVFFGAGIGGVLRQAVNIVALRSFGAGFPAGTLIINIAGSALMGILAGYFAFRGQGGDSWLLFLATGILGGFTTFSTFSLDTVTLIERGAILSAAIYVGASVVISLLGLFAGLWLMRIILS